MRRTILLALLGAAIVSPIGGETITIPGTIYSLCRWNNFFFNLPERDFIYCLNDALLFSEPPDNRVYREGPRDRLLKLEERHSQVKKYVQANGNAAEAAISFHLNRDEDWRKGLRFCELLGLALSRDKDGKFSVAVMGDESALPLDAFYGLELSTLTKQLNSSGILYFKLSESRVDLPWDLSFLNAVTGLSVDHETFFKSMIANKKFSLLLAILFRLSGDEIRYISRSLPQKPDLAWQRIFMDRKLMMGLMVLSSALRVQDERLLLPGGDDAHEFWKSLVGVDPRQSPYDFIAALASQDDGKLNYLYLFSFYLPEDVRQAVLFAYNSDKIKEIYEGITLGANEKIRADAFPRLEASNFMANLRAFQVKDGQIFFPLGVQAWADALGLKLPPGAGAYEFFLELLSRADKSISKMSLLQKFLGLYTRFADRLGILTPEVLRWLVDHYESKSSLIDFIEKIPLRKPETVEALFKWQQSLPSLNLNDQALFTALGQALLEIISQMAWLSPDSYDYDHVVNELLALSWQRTNFYDHFFGFIKAQTGVNSVDDVTDELFIDMILRGMHNQDLTIQGQKYEWQVHDVFKASLKEILRSQEDCTLSVLAEINAILDRLYRSPAGLDPRWTQRLLEAVEDLPYPDFSKDAPKAFRERVLAYPKAALTSDVQKLLMMSQQSAPKMEIRRMITEIKNLYLLPNLKDFLVTLAYALNARQKELRLFSNPNLVRLHDFSSTGGGSPWESGSSQGDKTKFSGYYLKGGLSRLDQTFSRNWCSQLFANDIPNGGQAQAMVTNVMAMLPQPFVTHRPAFDALLIEFAGELLQKCASDERIRTEVKSAAKKLIAGYHYRKLDDYLLGRCDDYNLFFSELHQMGSHFFERGSHLAQFSRQEALRQYAQMPLSSVIAQESHRWGNLYHQSSGSLRPRQFGCFPQEIAIFFSSGWISGEMIMEFKFKAAYLAHKNELPAFLLGQFVFDFFRSVLRPLYFQNHEKDYISTYFMMDIMNSGHLKSTLNKLKKEGSLKLK
jgi:hypothetical protein